MPATQPAGAENVLQPERARHYKASDPAGVGIAQSANSQWRSERSPLSQKNFPSSEGPLSPSKLQDPGLKKDRKVRAFLPASKSKPERRSSAPPENGVGIYAAEAKNRLVLGASDLASLELERLRISSAPHASTSGSVPKASPVRERSEERIDWLAMERVQDGEHIPRPERSAQLERCQEDDLDVEQALDSEQKASSRDQRSAELAPYKLGAPSLGLEGGEQAGVEQPLSGGREVASEADAEFSFERGWVADEHSGEASRGAKSNDTECNITEELSGSESEDALGFPTLEEVAAYAEYLGMKPEEDGELLWIAEQALMAPLPDGWFEEDDELGRAYFWDSENQEAHWKHPYDEDYKFLYGKLKRALASSAASREEVEGMATYLDLDLDTEAGLLWIAQQAVLAPLPPGWEEVQDKDGTFYYDRASHESQSEHPMDHIFRQLVGTERAKAQLRKQAAEGAEREDSDGEAGPILMTLVDEETGELYQFDWTSRTRLDQAYHHSKVHPEVELMDDKEGMDGPSPDLQETASEGSTVMGRSERAEGKQGKIATTRASEDGVDDGDRQNADEKKESYLVSGLKYLHSSLFAVLGGGAHSVH